MIYLEVKAGRYYDVYNGKTLMLSNGVHNEVAQVIDAREALLDGSRYIDIIPMNYTPNEDSVHNDEMPHGTTPDFYDFMVRGDELSEDTLYCEVEYVTEADVEAVTDILEAVYEL